MKKKKKKRGERKRLLVRWPGKLAAAAFQTLSLSLYPYNASFLDTTKEERKKKGLSGQDQAGPFSLC
jgi:hypothetical protein